MKKGLTPGVFNWIFVMIAGAVILLFFVKIISLQTAITEREIGATVLSDTQTILAGRATAEDTQAIIQIPNKPFEFVCQEPCNAQTGCDSWFGMPGGDLSIQTPLQPIFSPEKIETSELYAFVLGWNVPFHVSNFLILAQPGMKISFPIDCDTSSLCSEVYGLIPTPVKDRRIVTLDGFINNPNVRNIEFSSTCTQPHSYCIDESRQEITFPDGRVTTYYDAKTIVAALFAEDSAAYECNMKKSFFRLNRVVSVYDDKRERLLRPHVKKGWGHNPVCNQHYTLMEAQLQIIDDSFGFDPFAFNQAVVSIIESNNIVRRNSCGSLY